MSGTINLPRSLFDDTAFKDEPLSEREAYIWLLIEARWKAGSRRIDSEVFDLERGQLAASVRFLAAAWNWSKSRTDRYLGRLVRSGKIAVRTGTAASVITICNYDEYQGRSVARGTAAGQVRDSSGTNEKKGERREKDSVFAETHQFEAFWAAYPHGGGVERGKEPARALYANIVRAGLSEQALIAAAQRYRQDRRVVEGFVKDPLTWLANSCWQDGIEPARPAAVPPPDNRFGAFGVIPEVH